MAESDAMVEEDSGPEESFSDPDLLSEEDAEATPNRQPVQKRGKKKRGGLQDNSPRRRPFVESNVASNLAQNDLMNVMNRWDWDSAEYEVALYRAQPQTWQGRNCHGYLASFTHAIDEDYISQNFGGGVFDVKVRGPNAKTGVSKTFLDGCRIRISGAPILSDADKNFLTPDGQGVIMANPQKGPPSQKQRREAAVLSTERPRPPWMEQRGSNGSGPREDRDMVQMTFDRLSAREQQASEEARALREQLIEESREKRGSSGGLDPQSLRIIQDATDRAIEAEKRASERQREEFERIRQEEKESKREFESLVARLGERNTGIPPEMLQTLNESHRAEINALNESHRAEMRQERDRADREESTIRERYEAEIKAIDDKYRGELERTRTDLQSRLDREIESSKREIERIREQAKSDMDKTREELTRRLDEQSKEHIRQNERDRADFNRQIEQEREAARIRLEATENQARRDREAFEARAKSDKESMISQHQMQLEHQKGLQSGQLEQQKSQYEAQIAQMRSSHEAALTMQESTLKSQISSLQSELDRTRNDLVVTQGKVAEQGDLASQASKLREIGDNLGSVFGLGKPAELSYSGPPVDYEPEPKKKRKEGWMGSLMDFADSNLGQMAFEFFKQAAVGAAGPAPGMMPLGLPGQYGPPPGAYGPPSGYPPQTNPYGGMPAPGPSYGPPQQQNSYGPPQQQQNSYAPPYQEQYNVGQGAYVDDDYEDEEEFIDSGPEDEGSFNSGDRDDVVTAKPGSEQTAAPAPASGQPKPPQVGAPQKSRQQSSDGEAEIPPEVRQQLEGLIQGLESAMTNGQSPEELADTILNVAPAEQLKPFATTPINQLAEDISKVVPGTMLASYNGRKYLQQLQAILSRKIGA
jgi:hypothetical protein